MSITILINKLQNDVYALLIKIIVIVVLIIANEIILRYQMKFHKACMQLSSEQYEKSCFNGGYNQ